MDSPTNTKTLTITPKNEYTLIQLNRGKVNAINHQMVNELRQTFTHLEKNKNTKGVILTGIPNIFSAGLDLIELYEYDKQKIHDFFVDFSIMHVELVRFKKPFVCAITGYCPAGGTVMAITADYRVMSDNPKFSIGFNELAVHIQIAQNLIESYSYWLGTGIANQSVLEGKLFTPQEALTHHLVNTICPAEETLERAEKKIQEYLKWDEEIFINSKLKLRKPWLDRITTEFDEELTVMEALWWKPHIRTKIKTLIESFSTKKQL